MHIHAGEEKLEVGPVTQENTLLFRSSGHMMEDR